MAKKVKVKVKARGQGKGKETLKQSKPKVKAQPKIHVGGNRADWMGAGQQTVKVTNATAAKPGVHLDPFLTAEQILDKGSQERDWAREMAELERAFGQAAGELPEQLNRLNSDRWHNKEGVTGNAASRGLAYGSSAGNMALQDVAAQHVLSTDAANKFVEAAQRRLDDRRAQIDTEDRPAAQTYYNSAAAQNAKDAGGWKAPPVAAKPATYATDYDLTKPGIQAAAGRRVAAKVPTKPGARDDVRPARPLKPRPNRPGAPRKVKFKPKGQGAKPMETLR